MAKEYIPRDAAMPDGFCVGVSCQECPFCDDPVKGGCKVARFIDAIPAADVVEVVRCRECKYRDYDDAPYGRKVAVCTGAMAYSQTPDDWYCPMGKRKDGGQEDA